MIKDILQQNEDITPTSKQIAVLKEHFPACFKADGSFDLERFKAEIAGTTNVVQEGYELKFLGKSYAKLLASTDTTTVIKPNEAHNNLPENINSENIYISGDNLDGLKHLLKSYDKKIKCIYIDPPYNTGSDGFVYFDKFNYTKETLQEKLSVSEDEADRILELTKRGSASHSAWLMFMYSRLLLARDLLTNDGVIFISIDDNEQADLKLLCDDVFGEENFTSQIIWQKKYAASNDSTYLSEVHDYVLLYSRNKYLWQPNLFDRPKELNDKYKNPDNDPRGVWYPTNLSVKTYSEKNDYIITSPTGRKFSPPPSRCWVVSEEKYFELLKDNRIWFGGDGNSRPYEKKFLSEVQQGIVPTTLWLHTEAGHNIMAKSEIRELFSETTGLFDTPKPVKLLKRIIKLSQGKEKDDIILDFFSGSATTANAVLDLNEKEGCELRFIAIQLPEVLSIENDSQKQVYEFLKQNNLPTTLDYIGIERIKRAANKIKKENPDKALDLGFKHFILDEPNQNTLDKLESFDTKGLLADTSILDDFGKATILTTWLNDDGYGLTVKAEAIDLAGYTAYYYQKHLYLLDEGFSLESMKALLSKYEADGHFKPENIVLFGYSFAIWSISEMLEKNLRILNDGEQNLKINFIVRY